MTTENKAQQPQDGFRCGNPDCNYEMDLTIEPGQAAFVCPKCGRKSHFKVDDRDCTSGVKD